MNICERYTMKLRALLDVGTLMVTSCTIYLDDNKIDCYVSDDYPIHKHSLIQIGNYDNLRYFFIPDTNDNWMYKSQECKNYTELMSRTEGYLSWKNSI